MDDASDPSSGTFAEIRRRLARLFSSATVSTIDDRLLDIRTYPHRISLDTHPHGPSWGTQPGLLTSDDCSTRCSDPSSSSHALAIAVKMGESQSASGTVAAPAIHYAHYDAPAPTSVSLVSSLENAPTVFQPDITRPDSARVAGVIIAPPKARKAREMTIPVFKAIGKSPKAIGFGMRQPRILPVTPDISGEIYMERRRLPMPSRGSMAEDSVYPEHRAALSASAKLPQGDIKLVGVYCGVPLGAASRMEYDEITGSLHLTLRENASQSVLRLERPVVTLVLGKVKATGKVVRAVI